MADLERIWHKWSLGGLLKSYDLLRTPRLAIHSWSWDFFEISDLDGKCTYKQLFLFLANKVFWVDALYLNGAQWLSGWVLDSRPKGRGFEPHRRHCVVVLEQDTFILA